MVPFFRTAAIIPGGIVLQKVTGQRVASQWWTLFIQWCTLHNFVDNGVCAAFPFHLADGAPMLWYNNLAEIIRTNMDQLKTAFLAKFGSANNIFDVGLLRIKQKEDESVDDFFVRMETQIRDTVIPENILV